MRRFAVISIALVGCYSPRPAPGAPCGENDVCPTGLVCTFGTCELMPLDAAPPIDAPDAPIDVPPGALTITGLVPSSGIVGTDVTIAGGNFGAEKGTSEVLLDQTPMDIVAWSESAIVARVPETAFPQDAMITVVVGSMTSDAAQFAVILPPVVYISNDIGSPDTISVMSFDAATGSLTPLGQPVSKNAAAGMAPGCLQTLTVNPRTRRVFSTADAAVVVFDIDPRTGELTRVIGTPVSIPDGRSYGVQSNAAGTRVYVASPMQKTITGFEVSATGTLSILPGSPYDANGNVDTLVFSTDESILYASTQNGGLVTLTVGANGSLTRVTSVGTNNTVGLRRRPNTGQLFLVGGSLISVYSTTAGIPAAVAGSPFAANNLTGVPVFDEAHDRLYVPRDGTGQVHTFNLAANGTPTVLAGSPYNFSPGGADFTCGAISRDGTFLVIAGEATRQVSVFSLDDGGAPSPVLGTPFMQNAPASDASGLAITF